MKCPYCANNEDRVLDTREQKEGELIKRRRECMKCLSRFTTVESVLRVYPLVIKKDHRREAYNRAKILNGLQAACQKRPVSLAQMEQIVEIVSEWVLELGEKEISAQLIGQKVMMSVKALDDVAYVRFASVYRTFTDIHEFVSSLEPASPALTAEGERITEEIGPTALLNDHQPLNS